MIDALPSIRALLLVHAGVTVALAGLIWFVQIVHYPLFEAVGRDRFQAYERRHTARVSIVVVPLMLTELATSVALVTPAFRAELADSSLAWWGLGLVAVIWASTFALQVPQHRLLDRGFDLRAYRRLVATNWIRTAAWSARAILALLLV